MQGKSVVDRGGAVVEVLGSHGYFFPATRDYLTAWIETYGLGVTSVLDAPGEELRTLAALGIRETVVLVEVPSMQIVWAMTGDLGGIDPSSIQSAVAEMLIRLP